MFVALVWLFLVLLSTAIFVLLIFKKSIFLAWKAKSDAKWTTYYKAGCMHLVPLQGKYHSIEDDGDCQCRTRVDQYGVTKVYQHQRL
jgi:hypothetical protein